MIGGAPTKFAKTNAHSEANYLAFLMKHVGKENAFELVRYANVLGYKDLKSLIRDVRPTEELITGVFPGRGVVVLNGAAGIGKTYFILTLMLFIAAGRCDFLEWKLNITGKRVVYLCYEGIYTIPGRVAAIQAEYGIDIPADRFLIQTDPRKLTEKGALEELQMELDAIGANVVVIDTLGAATAGIDEDRSKDMSVVLEGVRKISDTTGSLIILVTHPPKGNAATVRGSNTIECNTDGMVNLRKSGSQLELTTKKIRTSSPAKPRKVGFKSIDLGPNADKPGERLIETVLVPSKPPSEPLELVLVELTEDTGEVSISDLVRELVARGVYTKSPAYRKINALLPKGEERLVMFRKFRRDGSAIKAVTDISQEELD